MVDSKSISNTLKIKVNLDLTVKDIISDAKAGINGVSTTVKFEVLFVSKHLNSKPLQDDLPLRYFFNNGDDIFCKLKLDNVVPLEKKELKQETNTTNTQSTNKVSSSTNVDDLTFIMLSKYSFYDDDKFVKVLVPITGIGAHPKDRIISEFTNRSFVVKIVDMNGSNYRYGVSKTHYEMIPNESKIIIKANEIVFKLKKAKSDEYWSFLHKTRMVGDGLD
jgi:hypothetical protein